MMYRIFFSDGNDRDELGRVNAPDMDKAIEYTLAQYFKPELEYQEEGDGENAILLINSCTYCDVKEIARINGLEDSSEVCENCETSEYIEITLDEDATPEFKTIYGVNEYADLEADIKPVAYNATLVKAWNMGPQIGATELMHQTINNMPVMVESIDFEYLQRINKNHEEVLKE